MPNPCAPGDPSSYNLHLVLSLYSRHSLRPVVPQRRTLMEAVAGIYPNAAALEREIVEIQGRLGTPDERPGDMDRAKAAAHVLSNMICAALLMGDVDGLDVR